MGVYRKGQPDERHQHRTPCMPRGDAIQAQIPQFHSEGLHRRHHTAFTVRRGLRAGAALGHINRSPARTRAILETPE